MIYKFYKEVFQKLINNKGILVLDLSKKLRSRNFIITPGAPFEENRKRELEGLMQKGVFELTPYDPANMSSFQVFKHRFINEIRGKATDTPCEKLRLVIQAYYDVGENEILTQLPTIQRVSQCIILALAASLKLFCNLHLRDVSQAYVQSTTLLNRQINGKPPRETADSLPPNKDLAILKHLYDIPEAGTH